MELVTFLKHLLTHYYLIKLKVNNLFIPTNDTINHSSEGESSGYTNSLVHFRRHWESVKSQSETPGRNRAS